MLDNGFVIGCVFSPQVLYNRLNATPAFTSASRSVYGNDGRDRRQMDNGEELSEEDLLRLRQDERVFTPHFTFLEDEEFDDGEEDGEDSCEEEEEEESDEDR